MQEFQSIRIKSFTGENWYTISPLECTCSCASFPATRKLCKHLNAVGVYVRSRPFSGNSHPTFSQALSGLVKSIRLRRVGDAVYWLVYQNAFGATWTTITAIWNTPELRVKLFYDGNPAKPSSPQLSVENRAIYVEDVDRKRPLD